MVGQRARNPFCVATRTNQALNAEFIWDHSAVERTLFTICALTCCCWFILLSELWVNARNSKTFLSLPKLSPRPPLCHSAQCNQSLQDFIFYYFTENISAWDTANQSDQGCPVVRWHVKLYYLQLCYLQGSCHAFRSYFLRVCCFHLFFCHGDTTVWLIVMGKSTLLFVAWTKTIIIERKIHPAL